MELLVQRLADPTTAYLLFVLGLFAIFVEVSHPGGLVPGLAGVVSLLLAIAAFTALPVNPIGALLILAAVTLMGVDVKAFGHGGLTLIGVGCLVVGSLLLYGHGAAGADVTIATPVLVLVAAVGLGLGLGLLRLARNLHHLPPALGDAALVGARGVARSALAPNGVVHVNGQLWSAHAASGELPAGEPIRVRARHGLVLEVEPVRSLGAATQKRRALRAPRTCAFEAGRVSTSAGSGI